MDTEVVVINKEGSTLLFVYNKGGIIMKCPFVIKVCTKCKRILVAYEGNFGKHKNCKYGLASRCKICDKEYYKEWSKENEESIKKYNKEYNKKNKELKKEYDKKYYKKNIANIYLL